MLIQIARAEVVGPYTLRLVFTDGTDKRVNLRKWLNGPIFSALRNPANFAKVIVDGETITWPDFNADMAPEFLYALDAEPETQPADQTN